MTTTLPPLPKPQDGAEPRFIAQRERRYVEVMAKGYRAPSGCLLVWHLPNPTVSAGGILFPEVVSGKRPGGKSGDRGVVLSVGSPRPWIDQFESLRPEDRGEWKTKEHTAFLVEGEDVSIGDVVVCDAMLPGPEPDIYRVPHHRVSAIDHRDDQEAVFYGGKTR